jgi:hypothetical protein
MEMLLFKTALLAGVAALATLSPAWAQTAHVLTVALPGGGVAEIHYTGNIPPKVVFGEAPPAFAAWSPAESFFGPDSPFAMMERISAQMDREAAATLRRAELLAREARSGQPIETGFANLPAGGNGYTFISTMSGNGVCTRSVEITARGNAQPKVVSHSSGNCGPAGSGSAGATTLPRAPALPAKQPDLVLTNANGVQPFGSMVRHIAAAQR